MCLFGQVALIIYSTNVRVEFDLARYTRQDDLLRAIADLRFIGGETFTGRALQEVRNNVFIASRGDRQNFPNYVILVTDGLSNDNEAISAAATLKNEGAYIVAVGVSRDFNARTELESIASNRNEVFFIDNFLLLNSIVSSVTRTSCPTGGIIIAPPPPAASKWAYIGYTTKCQLIT